MRTKQRKRRAEGSPRIVVYRVEFHSREVPKCYRRWTVKGIDPDETVIYVSSRKRRDELLICDRSATWAEVEFRRCPRCKRALLGFAAQSQRLEGRAVQPRLPARYIPLVSVWQRFVQ